MALIDKEIVKLAWTKRFRSELTEDKDYYLWLCECQKWLYEKHDIVIAIVPSTADEDTCWGRDENRLIISITHDLIYSPFNRAFEFYIWVGHKYKSNGAGGWKYEEALEEGIDWVFTEVKKFNK